MVCTNALVKWYKEVQMRGGQDTLAQTKLKVVFGHGKATEIGSDSGFHTEKTVGFTPKLKVSTFVSGRNHAKDRNKKTYFASPRNNNVT